MPVDADTSSMVIRCTALAPAIRAVSLSYGLGRLAFGIVINSFVEALDGCGVEIRKEGGRGSGSASRKRAAPVKSSMNGNYCVLACQCVV